MGIYSKQAGEVSGCHMSMDAVGIRLHQKSEKNNAFNVIITNVNVPKCCNVNWTPKHQNRTMP